MIKSMTGYGKAEAILDSGKVTIEIRTLNGKSADVSIKTPLLPKEKELEVRQKIADNLQRGTIDFFLTYEQNAVESARAINSELVFEYYRQIQDIIKTLNAQTPDIPVIDADSESIFSTILKFPDVMDSKKQDIINEENWPLVERAIDKALANVNDYRAKEGAALYKDVTSRVANILEFEKGVESFEQERISEIKEKLTRGIEELKLEPDKSRFEQEIIYYLEKLDINEEKVRLRQHCKYFMDTIDNEEYPGKKLGFIIQEMGREINTTGSKANHAGIQKFVVKMKDELEKIREQSMNIL